MVSDKKLDQSVTRRRCNLLKNVIRDVDKIAETEPKDEILEDIDDFVERASDIEEEFGCLQEKGRRKTIRQILRSR